MTAIQRLPERTPFNYADLTDYREGQITSLALIRSKGVNMTILAFDSEQLLPHSPDARSCTDTDSGRDGVLHRGQ